MQKTAFVEVMFRSFLTTLFIVVSLSSFAQQTATVYGRITDTDGKAIPYANVIAIDRNINAQSDVDGNYTIKIPANDTVVLKYSNLSDTAYRKVFLEPDERYVIIVKLSGYQLGTSKSKSKKPYFVSLSNN